jgi:hypothetical protein
LYYRFIRLKYSFISHERIEEENDALCHPPIPLISYILEGCKIALIKISYIFLGLQIRHIAIHSSPFIPAIPSFWMLHIRGVKNPFSKYG